VSAGFFALSARAWPILDIGKLACAHVATGRGV